MGNSKKWAFVLIVFLAAFLASAQEEDGSDPRLNEKGDMLFSHNFIWEPTDLGVNYLFILDQLRGDNFVEVMRRSVEGTSLQISIPSGRYRYRVLSFNVLGRLDAASDWVYISILQALQPGIFGFSPDSFYFDRQALRIIEVEGANLLAQSEIYLLRRKSGKAAEGETAGPPTADDIILPRETRRNELGESAHLVFSEESLVEGIYDIVVINPGGLEAQAGPFKISVAKPYDINVSAGYFPLMKLFDSSSYVLSQEVLTLAFGAFFSFVPFKTDFGFFGVELNSVWAYMQSETGDERSPASHSSLLSAHVNFLYQYWLVKKVLAYNVRAGVGASGLLGYQLEYHTGLYSNPHNFVFLSWGGGVSLQWFLFRRWYVEGGAEYFHIHDNDLPMGFVRFSICSGWQF